MAKIGLFIEDEWVLRSYTPIMRELKAAGHLPLLITTNDGDGGFLKSIPFNASEPLHYLPPDLSIDEVKLEDFRGFIFGGGYWADRLRWWLQARDESGNLQRPQVRELLERIILSPAHLKGTICHSMWLFCSFKETVQQAGGRKFTCAYNIIDDITNAGFTYVDADVHVDGNFVSGRMSDHSTPFIQEYIRHL